ncbi:S-layer homology domain-containing protein, partial [Oscillibacter sp.]|uniref:S-layer homology domain-containing protein n=1 Tax=Oscillibacter sp. TaxID=1945593 RepID=UPI0033908B8D
TTSSTDYTQDFDITVSAAEHTYGISLSQTAAYTFTGQTAGYSTLTSLSVTITSTGNQATGDLTVALSGDNTTSFTLSKTTISSIAESGTDSFTVTPVTGLGAGTYTAAVTVSGGNVTAQTFNVSFTVGSSGNPGGGTPSGGGSSASPSSNITVSTNNNTATASQTLAASTGSNGVAAASATSSQISEMLAAAEAKAPTDAQAAVNLQVQTGSGATGVSVTLPQSAVTALTSGEASLTVSSSVATVTLDSATLAEISKHTSGDVTITATAADTTALSAETKTAIGTRPVYDLKITSGSTTVSSFGGGTATVSVPYTPAAGENVNAIVVYYINASGELVTVPNCSYDAKTGTVTFTTTHFSTYAVGYNKASFKDVSDNAWYANYVTYLAARGIVGGNNGTFSPDASITRAEFVTILARMSGDDLSGYKASSFSDVSADSWYFAAVQWANKAGIASGYDGKFNPNETITREQMAAMLYRYAEYKGTVSNTEGMSVREFSDYSKISSWAQAPIQWAMNNKILSGNTDGSFAPQSSATRAQAAKMLAVLLQGTVK